MWHVQLTLETNHTKTTTKQVPIIKPIIQSVQFVRLLCTEIDLCYKELWHFFAKIPATQSKFLSLLVECMSNIGGGAGGAQAPQ